NYLVAVVFPLFLQLIYAHLRGDVNHVYRQLTLVWLGQMEYLAANYPYLLSLSLRKSLFNIHCDIVVRE
ncbi:MAG TPA: hypothetical protein O0W88_03650, partial [Methanocorpusculum sp.]|nr:hypothetical protein [Methanocorpusculum sp.]